MQIGQYQVSNASFTAGATMGYYADGRTNTAYDLNDSRFDRKYEFDSSARLKEAYTGVEAMVLPRLRWHRQTVLTGRLTLMTSGTMSHSAPVESGRRRPSTKRSAITVIKSVPIPLMMPPEILSGPTKVGALMMPRAGQRLLPRRSTGRYIPTGRVAIQTGRRWKRSIRSMVRGAS